MLILELRYFLAPKGAEQLSGQDKEVDDLKTPETFVKTGFIPSLAESPSISGFEAKITSVFV